MDQPAVARRRHRLVRSLAISAALFMAGLTLAAPSLAAPGASVRASSAVRAMRVPARTTRSPRHRVRATGGARDGIRGVVHAPRGRLQAPRPAAAVSPASPLAGLRLYVDPESDAATQAAAWQASDPAGAAVMDRLAAEPTAAWFGDWTSDVTASVGAQVAGAAQTGSIAQLVAYDIPDRDCGGYSGGGAPSAAAYEAWIDAFAAGIGSHAAIVILEPDSLAQLGCLSATAQATRLSLLRYAVASLAAHPGVSVYLDGGHSGWESPATMAARLSAAGVAQAQGFALNVANFDATANEVAYGKAISDRIGGRHFVIDTSRNGAGSDGQWCNPVGAALGADPTTETGRALVDAYLWIKTPGESDGTCHGGPAAGTWWASDALGLAGHAGW